jgi:hypothetical protein
MLNRFFSPSRYLTTDTQPDNDDCQWQSVFKGANRTETQQSKNCYRCNWAASHCIAHGYYVS